MAPISLSFALQVNLANLEDWLCFRGPVYSAISDLYHRSPARADTLFGSIVTSKYGPGVLLYWHVPVIKDLGTFYSARDGTEGLGWHKVHKSVRAAPEAPLAVCRLDVSASALAIFSIFISSDCGVKC